MLASGLIAFGVAFAVSYIGVRTFISFSQKKAIFDVPNERSSHLSPTPRGGGLIIVIVSLGFYISLPIWAGVPVFWAYVVSATAVAGISLIDDLRSVPFIWRLLVHIAAALFFTEEFVRVGYLSDANGTATLARMAGCILWIVWLINAYNFMDGIDGIAGVQTLIAGFGWFAIMAIMGAGSFSLYPLVIVASTLGFLALNWPPARIFMGDVGSTFLGFTFAVMPFLSFTHGAQSLSMTLLIGVILVWFFVFDTVFTLIRRALRSEKIWTAHREHIYQGLVIAGMSHAQATLLYGALALILTIGMIAATWSPRFGFYSLLAVPVLTTVLLLIRFKNRLT